MILDERMLFSHRQPVTTSALSSVVDLGDDLPSLPVGCFLRVTVDELPEAVEGGVVGVVFSLESSDAEDMSGGTVHMQTTTLDDTELVPGAVVWQQRLPTRPPYRRFLAVRFTVADELAAGAFTASAVVDPSLPTIYPRASF